MTYGKYLGSYGSMEPYSSATSSEIFTGYNLPAGRKIGAATSTQTANQIKEVSDRLNEGMKDVELSIISPEVFEAIPKAQFKEIYRLSKLAGTEATMHAPIVDPAGLSTERPWSETARIDAERLLLNAVERGHEANPEGNMPVTIHASAIPAIEWQASKNGKEKPIPSAQIIVNADTGELSQVKREEKLFNFSMKSTVRPVEEMIESRNHTEWSNSITAILNEKTYADKFVHEAMTSEARLLIGELQEGRLKINQLDEHQGRVLENYQRNLAAADNYYGHIQSRVMDLYDKAAKSLERWDKSKKEEANACTVTRKELENIEKQWNEAKREGITPEIRRELMEMSLHKLERIPEPRIYVPVEDFALDKASTTLSNVAFKSFERFKENSPIISIENISPNMAFSTAGQLRKLVEKSRDKFTEMMMKKENVSRERAEMMAEKLIGATWDVAHINLMKKSGFKGKDIIEETKKIAPYVKHMHLVDNFGYNDSHLPIGMGNVPIKEIMEEMEKAGYSGKMISEAAGFVQHFKTSPHPYELEALGSPVHYGGGMSFGEARSSFGGYFTGYGTFLPEQHFSMYGGGFSTLPVELGGRVQGKQSQFSGTPME